MEKTYRNLGYVLIGFIPLSIFAFYKTYFNQFPHFDEIKENYVHIHALIASFWILLLIVQPLAIRYRKIKLHRSLGKMSYLILPILVMSFVPLILRTYHSDFSHFIFFPIADSILLVFFYVLGIHYRKHQSRHMRYMIGTALVFLGPTIGRVGPLWFKLSNDISQNIMYGLIYIILGGLIWRDFVDARNYRPYMVILVAWICHQVAFYLFF